MSRVWLFIVFLITVVNAQTQRYALIVGQNDGGAEVNKLQYAERDARRVADVLRELGDFQKDNSIVLLSPDSSDFEKQLEKLAQKIKDRGEQDRSLFLLYFSGHADANSLLLGNTRFSLEKLQSLISRFPSAFRIAIFDACQSGAVTAYKGGKRAEPFYLQNSGALVKGQVIIASASAQERAQESSTLKGSIFTFHWINGLNGSADISSDNQVTLNEAYQYAYRKTIETSALSTGEIQHPVYRFNITGQGDIILSNLNKSEAGVVLGRDCEGKFLVLSEDYLEVYADVFKDRDRDVFISLRNGAYTIVNARGRDVGTLSLNLKKKSVFKIQQSMFAPNTLTESRIKGRIETDSTSVVKKSENLRSSLYYPGIGMGFSLYPDLTNENWERDLNIQLTNVFVIKDNVSIFLDIDALLFSKIGGIRAGLDFSHNNGVADLYLGTGIGMEYTFEKYEKIRDALDPALTVHAGFLTGLGENTNLQVRIPFTVVFHETTQYRVGIDLSFLLKIKR